MLANIQLYRGRLGCSRKTHCEQMIYHLCLIRGTKNVARPPTARLSCMVTRPEGCRGSICTVDQCTAACRGLLPPRLTCSCMVPGLRNDNIQGIHSARDLVAVVVHLQCSQVGGATARSRRPSPPYSHYLPVCVKPRLPSGSELLAHRYRPWSMSRNVFFTDYESPSIEDLAADRVS